MPCHPRPGHFRRNKPSASIPVGAIQAGKIAVVIAALSVPLVLLALPSAPAGYSGAPGEGTCAACHSGTSHPSGSVSVTFPGGLTYTPSVATQLTVTVTETGQARWGFEVSARAGSNQAGSFGTVDSNTQILSTGVFQEAGQTAAGTFAGTANTASWNFDWIPPATNVGNITFYVVGLASNNDGTTVGDDTFTATYTLTPNGGSGGGGNTLTVNPTMLTFNSAGSAPPSQTFHVASSGASASFTTSVSTPSGFTWLSAKPSGGMTPLDVSVSADPTGLGVGTYMGTVMVTSSGLSGSPQSVSVSLKVSSATGTTSLKLDPPALTLHADASSAAAPEKVHVSSGDTTVGFTAAASTSSGGNWLSVTPTTGTTPDDVSVSVLLSGLAQGTYSGMVTFTPSGASVSPKVLPVTLVIKGSEGQSGSVVPLTYSFDVLDKQSNGTDWMLLDGSGATSPGGKASGSGAFIRFNLDSSNNSHTVSTGTWTATTADSFTPGTGGAGGVLVIEVNLAPMGGTPSKATLRIADTGSDNGVTFTPATGSVFNPSGIGHVSIAMPPSPGFGFGDGDRGRGFGFGR